MAIGTPVERYAVWTTFASGSTTKAISPATDFTAGTLAIAFGSISTASATPMTLSSVVDSKGNTWTIDKQYNNTANQTVLFMASAQMTSPVLATDTITFTRSLSTPGMNFFLFVVEVSGLATATPFDQSAQNSGTGTAYSVGPTAALSQADEIAIATWSNTATTSPAHTPGAGWSEFTATATVGQNTAVYQIVSSTSALTASETSTSANWAGIIGTYKAAAAGGGGSSTLASSYSGAAFLHMKGIR